MRLGTTGLVAVALAAALLSWPIAVFAFGPADGVSDTLEAETGAPDAFGLALRSLSGVEDPYGYGRMSVARWMADSGRQAGALSYLQAQPQIVGDAGFIMSYYWLGPALRGGQFDLALDYFILMDDVFTLDAWTHRMLDLAEAEGRLGSMIVALEAMPSPESRAAVASRLALRVPADRGKEILHEAREALAGSNSPTPDTSNNGFMSRFALAVAHYQLGEVDDAVALAETLEREHLDPDGWMPTVARLWGLLGRYDRGERLARPSASCQSGLTGLLCRIVAVFQPPARTWSAKVNYAQGLAVRGDWERAFSTAESVRKGRARATVFSAILASALRVGNEEVAGTALSRLRAELEGIKDPDQAYYGIAFDLLDELEEIGRAEEAATYALDLLQEPCDQMIQYSVGQMQLGNERQAIELLAGCAHQMPRNFPQRLAEASFRAGRGPLGAETFAALEAWADKGGNPESAARAHIGLCFFQVLAMEGEVGDHQCRQRAVEAFHVLEAHPDLRDAAKTRARLASLLGWVGEDDLAHAVVAIALEVAMEEVGSHYSRADTLAGLAFAEETGAIVFTAAEWESLLEIDRFFGTSE